MTDKDIPISVIADVIHAHSADIAGLTAAITVLTAALLDSCEINKETMLKTIDKHCAKFSQNLLEANERISSADRILLDIRSVVAEHMKEN